MLQAELVAQADVEKAAAVFYRDGFVAINDALTPEQLAFAQAGANRVIKEQTEAIALEEANRGFARYSFGGQSHHPEWLMLADLPGITAIIDKIWNSTDYHYLGGGGDYSVPGAKIQPLHADIGEFLYDPWGQASFHDLPAPFIVVNYLMVDFTEANGAIRFIPATQRSRNSIPSLEEEPEWMKNNHLCAPAGTAIIRDVRCWHGGTANTSDQIRPMTSAAYTAPWFRLADTTRWLERDLYQTLSPRGQHLAREVVMD